VSVAPLDHQPAVEHGKLWVAATRDVGGLVQRQPQLGWPSLVIGRDGAAINPDSQFDGFSPTNAAACLPVVNPAALPNQARTVGAREGSAMRDLAFARSRYRWLVVVLTTIGLLVSLMAAPPAKAAAPMEVSWTEEGAA